MHKPVSGHVDFSRIKKFPVPEGFPVRKLYEHLKSDHEEVTYMEATAAGQQLLRTIAAGSSEVPFAPQCPGLRRCEPVVGQDGWFLLRRGDFKSRNIAWLEYKSTAWLWDTAVSHWGMYSDYIDAKLMSLSVEAVVALLQLHDAPDTVKFTNKQEAIVRYQIIHRRERLANVARRRLRKMVVRDISLGILKLLVEAPSQD